MKIDLYDKKILFELDINSRIPASKIAKKIKLPKETVLFRIKKMREKSIISRLYPIYNLSSCGYVCYMVFLKLHQITTFVEKKLINFLKNDMRCSTIRINEGEFDCSFTVVNKSISELKNFLEKFLSRFGTYVSEKVIHKVTNITKSNQKLFIEGKSNMTSFSWIENKKYDLDDIDKNILKELSTNARKKLVDMSSKIDVDTRVIRYRMKRLEKRGIISCYTSELNLKFIEKEFITISISLKRPNMARKIITFFESRNVCRKVYQTIGKYDLILDIHVKDNNELRNLTLSFREEFLDNYIDYVISPVYKQYDLGWYPE